MEERIELTGRLARDGGGFVLHSDAGARVRLELSRTPVDEVEHQVRVVGHYAAEDHLVVDGLTRL